MNPNSGEPRPSRSPGDIPLRSFEMPIGTCLPRCSILQRKARTCAQEPPADDRGHHPPPPSRDSLTGPAEYFGSLKTIWKPAFSSGARLGFTWRSAWCRCPELSRVTGSAAALRNRVSDAIARMLSVQTYRGHTPNVIPRSLAVMTTCPSRGLADRSTIRSSPSEIPAPSMEPPETVAMNVLTWSRISISDRSIFVSE